jgi:Carboxypeptidase regulatory-like domain
VLRALALLGLLTMLTAPAVAYEVVTVPDGGVLAGTVRFTGTPPRLAPITVSRDRDVCGDSKDPEALVLGPDRGVRGSVILVGGVARGKAPAADVLLDSSKCLFVPHVSATMPGERARVRNSDTLVHNPHGFLGKPTVLNLALPRDQMIDVTRRLTQPGVVRVVCDVHLHMVAWMVVHDSPYYAVTDERGAFRIEGLPPGSYKVTMWHEGFRPRGLDRDGRALYDEPRTRTREIAIAPRGTATIDFELR